LTKKPAGGLGRLGRELRVRVDVGQREVAPDEEQVVVVGELGAGGGFGEAAVGALEIAILGQDNAGGRPR